MISKRDVLIARDSKGKIREINIWLEWVESFQIFIIHRNSGLYKGKATSQPDIEIKKGKAKRTIQEQATLEYNSYIKKYLDKGYKNIKDLGYADLSQFDPDKALPQNKTDANNIGKPMLCKVYDASDSKTQKVPYWLISRKYDGRPI